ncbi:sodium-coupled monocarboxylate transporter 1-like [Amphiura filiformis]|uniref:sodium-coupled monocarboxylate transporter 1-like n=1 Tax=Amphiura filiformis TaxID=82378 RepID=UPI003B2244D5
MASGDVYPLDTWDYVVFSLFLAVSVLTGLYHGFAKGGQRSTRQYLLADRNVFSVPVAMTLLASFLSPITLLGDPAETYVNGGLYFAVIFSNFLLYPTIALFFVPMFYNLEITSVYEYLDRRFGLIIRIFGAMVFFLQTALYMAIVSYSPAIAIETGKRRMSSGIGVHLKQ